MGPTANIVVISDLHLGEDLAVDASEQTRRDVAMASAAAADFLRHLTQRKVDGLPWKLVINGDMVDFLSVHVSPSDPRLAGATELGGLGHRDRLVHGAGRVPAASAVRIDMIAEKHAAFFRALARFVGAGHRVDIVAGNHDREITHPLVAERVRVALRAHGLRERELIERVAFHDWFVHEPGVAWIEHGHQYDEQCSFEHGLAPEGPKGEIIPNVDAASLRWLKPVAPVDAHSTEEWTFGGYLRFGWGLGLRRFVRLLGGYAKFVIGLWHASRVQQGLLSRRRRAHRHEDRMAALADERGVAPTALASIDGMRRLPITRSMWRVCRMLLVDRMALTALTALATVCCALWGGWPWGFVGAVVTAGGGYGVGMIGATHVPRDPSLALATVPERIKQAIGAPIIVFGHTHNVMRLPLSAGGVYINAGTWLPATKPGLLRAFTHVVILHGKFGPEVHLRQWRDGRSRPFEGATDLTPPMGVPKIAA